MGLHGLPVELLRMVLEEIEDPEDLVSMIQASSHCLAVYNSNKIHVLTTILERNITPTGLPYALAVAHHSNSAPDSESGGDEDVIDFDQLRLPPDHTALLTIWRRHTIISNHIKVYSQWAQREVHLLNSPTLPPQPQHESPNDPSGIITAHSPFSLEAALYDSDSPFDHTHRNYSSTRADSVEGLKAIIRHAATSNLYPTVCVGDAEYRYTYKGLSFLEKGRFERAFYRHELYSRIASSRSWTLPPFQSYNLFTNAWQPWETAELLCVHAYFNRVIRERIWSLHREFQAAVLDTPGIVKAFDPDQLGKRATKLPPGMRHVRGLSECGLTLFDVDYRDSILSIARSYEEVAGRLAIKGAAFVARLVSSDLTKFTTMVSVKHPGCRDVAWEMRHWVGPRATPIWTDKIVRPADEGVADHLDGIRSGTWGFRSIYKDVLSDAPIHNTKRLSILATPFWDADRIRTGPFQAAVKEIFDNVHTEMDCADLAFSIHTAGWSLRGVAIPTAKFRKIRKQFGVEPIPRPRKAKN